MGDGTVDFPAEVKGWTGVMLSIDFRANYLGGIRGDSLGVYLNAANAAVWQRSVGLVYERFQRAGNPFDQHVEARQLLTSARQYWKSLQEIDRRINQQVPELAAALADNAYVIEGIVKARNHSEHIMERIREGRKKRGKTPDMDKDTFRHTMGKIEGRKIIFGDEVFDLEEIAEAVQHAGKVVPPAVEQYLMSSIKLVSAAKKDRRGGLD